MIKYMETNYLSKKYTSPHDYNNFFKADYNQ